MGILTDGPAGLFSKLNKSKSKGNDDAQQEGVIQELGELTLELDDDELLKLSREWTALYSNSEAKNRISIDGDTNQRYWRGRQFPDSEYENNKRPLTDNIIFEALETFLPIATQQNPEPVVETDDSPEMTVVKDKIYQTLKYLSRINHLKTKIKKGVRNWSLRFLGVWKIGWNAEQNEIVLTVVRPQKLVLDPNSSIDDGEYTGLFLGEQLDDTARNLIVRFPKKEKEITEMCDGKLGSLMSYTQWWTSEYFFYTMDKIILAKFKNPHWNYNKQTLSVDPNGQPVVQDVKGNNHLSHPQIPYVFLTVFDLGDEPCDKTNLIAQGLVTQDNINKRLKQIDRNADNINGGIVVSGQYFNKEQAAQVAEARRQGRTITVPAGELDKAIMFPTNAELPSFVYESLLDSRSRFLARFGVSGSTPSSTSQEETVRGKIIVGDQDSSRIGGGVTEYIELAASRIFNWFVQMIYVYYNEPHEISILGPQSAQELMTIQSSEMPQDRKIFISVQDGSLVPQDALSEYNQAMSLWEGGALDPLTLFERTKDPNPIQTATRLMVYKSNPALYSQEYLQIDPMAVMPTQPMPEGGGGSTSGAPPASVPQQEPVPSPVEAQASNLLDQVPQPAI